MKKTHSYIAIIILTVVSIACLIPFLIVLSSSFTDELFLKVNGYNIFPGKFSLDAYKTLFNNPKPIITAYATTIFTTTVGTALGVSMICGLAYAISRQNYKYKKGLSMFIYITMLFSGGLVPSYILIATVFNMKNTIWALILPLTISGYNVYLMKSFFRMVPTSLYESAKLDGASEMSIFFKIALPLAKTGIATIALMQALAYWNEWFMSMLYIDNDKIVTLQYLLVKLLNNVAFMMKSASSGSNFGSGGIIPAETVRMATCIVTVGPILLVLPFFQKYLVGGMTVGAIKE